MRDKLSYQLSTIEKGGSSIAKYNETKFVCGREIGSRHWPIYSAWANGCTRFDTTFCNILFRVHPCAVGPALSPFGFPFPSSQGMTRYVRPSRAVKWGEKHVGSLRLPAVHGDSDLWMPFDNDAHEPDEIVLSQREQGPHRVT
ncbi:hypothetical protein LIA77_04472 [Sarocladium implicatum]|nr:hypothetical protein LIA77_04472 [Sarocladium implicatum]